MALIDVTDLLADPDFVEPAPLTVRRSAVSVNEHGRKVATPSVSLFTAVVTQNGGADLVRGPDGSMISGDIVIHTTFRLTEEDDVIWKGTTYTVKNVRDWSSFGRGFVCAIAIRRPLNG